MTTSISPYEFLDDIVVAFESLHGMIVSASIHFEIFGSSLR
jgi:hypothetical protein